MNARRTNDDMFSLGQWAGAAEHELDTQPRTASVLTLKAYIGACKDSKNFAALSALRGLWEQAEQELAGVAHEELAKGDSRDEAAK